MSFLHPHLNSLDSSLTAIITAIALVLLTIAYYLIKYRGVLPGPKGLPYLGLYPFLTDENVHLKFEEYKKKYGDIFTFTYTGRLYINLGSIKAMKEILLQKSDCFIDRFKDSNILNLFVDNGVLPGPKGLPYFGLYPFQTDKNVHFNFEEYKKKYGDIFTFTYTGRLYINLGSIKAMKEILLQKSDCFIDRFKDSNILNLFVDNGLLMVNGENWKVQRKFFIQKFKEYGLNTKRGDMTGPVYDSLNAAIEDLKYQHEKPVDIVEFLSKHCTVLIRKMMFGEKGITDHEISKMVTAYVGALEGNGGVNLLLIGPLAKLFFYTKRNFQQNIKSTNSMKNIITDCLKRIESSLTDDEPTCIVEEFYKERNKRRKNNDPTWIYFSDDVLIENVFHFVGDGIASVAGFIAGILNTLLDYPEEQEKLYSEIIEVIGPNREPTFEDRPNMPYTHAFLNECCRMTKFLVFFPGHECKKETTIRGYRIPRGAITVYNFWSAHHDEETYKDPYTFNPSRYLQGEGKSKEESPVLFGMGKRICTAEPMIMLQAFLFLTTIVKYFRVVSSNAPSDTRMEFLISEKLELTFIPRKET